MRRCVGKNDAGPCGAAHQEPVRSLHSYSGCPFLTVALRGSGRSRQTARNGSASPLECSEVAQRDPAGRANRRRTTYSEGPSAKHAHSEWRNAREVSGAALD